MNAHFTNLKRSSLSFDMTKKELIEKINLAIQRGNKRIEGSFYTSDRFNACDPMNVIGWNMPGLKRKAAYLSGFISSAENKSVLHLETRPNLILPWFAIAAFVTSIFLFGLSILGFGSVSFNLIIGSVLISISLIYYPLSLFFSQSTNKSPFKSIKGLN